MKKNLYLLFAGLFLSVFLFSACKDDPHDELPDLSGDISQYVPDYSCTLSVNTSKYDNNLSFVATVTPFADLSKWGLRITKVVYLLDGGEIESTSMAPYVCNYGPEKVIPGKHILEALVHISGEKCDPLVLTLQHDLSNGSGGGDDDGDRAAADINWIYNYVGQGDTFEMEIYLNQDRSSKGLSIESATASLGPDNLGTRYSAPYKFSHYVNEAPGTVLPVSAEVKYSYKGSSYTTSYSFPAYQVMASDAVALRFQLLSSFQDYRNGERLKGLANPYIGRDVTNTYQLTLYIDDTQIAEITSFPGELDYLLEGLEAGEHVLTVEWTCYDEDGNKKFTSAQPRELYISE